MGRSITNITKAAIQKTLLGASYLNAEIKFYGEVCEFKFFYTSIGQLLMTDFIERVQDKGIGLSINGNGLWTIEKYGIIEEKFEDDWFFNGDIISLNQLPIEMYLDVLCEVFHPEVREEDKAWRVLLQDINTYLSCDGYELYPVGQISKRDIFSWREKASDYEADFFSTNHDTLDEAVKFPKNLRELVYVKMSEVAEHRSSYIDENLLYGKDNLVFERLKTTYVPKNYNDHNEFANSENLMDFMNKTSKPYFMDGIEAFASIVQNQNFEDFINATFKRYKLPYEMEQHRFYEINNRMVEDNEDKKIKDQTLQDYLDQANSFYMKREYDQANREISMALERIKSNGCSAKKDKAKAITKLINKMIDKNTELYKNYDDELKYLTKTSNTYGIRHSEVYQNHFKTDIIKKYFFNRTKAFIIAALDTLTNN